MAFAPVRFEFDAHFSITKGLLKLFEVVITSTPVGEDSVIIWVFLDGLAEVLSSFLEIFSFERIGSQFFLG